MNVKKSQLSRTYISDCHHFSLLVSVQSCLITEYPGICSFFIHVEAMLKRVTGDNAYVKWCSPRLFFSCSRLQVQFYSSLVAHCSRTFVLRVRSFLLHIVYLASVLIFCVSSSLPSVLCTCSFFSSFCCFVFSRYRLVSISLVSFAFTVQLSLQGHPMDLFLKISVLQPNFCWLGDLDKIKCPWKLENCGCLR